MIVILKVGIQSTDVELDTIHEVKGMLVDCTTNHN